MEKNNDILLFSFEILNSILNLIIFEIKKKEEEEEEKKNY